MQEYDFQLIAYSGQLHALFTVWIEQHQMLQQYLARAADDSLLETHFRYMEAFDRAVRRNEPPPGGEIAQQALLAMSQAKIAEIRAVMDGSGEEQGHFDTYEVECDRFTAEWRHILERAGLGDLIKE